MRQIQSRFLVAGEIVSGTGILHPRKEVLFCQETSTL